MCHCRNILGSYASFTTPALAGMARSQSMARPTDGHLEAESKNEQVISSNGVRAVEISAGKNKKFGPSELGVLRNFTAREIFLKKGLDLEPLIDVLCRSNRRVPRSKDGAKIAWSATLSGSDATTRVAPREGAKSADFTRANPDRTGPVHWAGSGCGM